MAEPATPPATRLRMRRMRVVWLPVLLVFLNALLLVLGVLLLLVFAPVALVFLVLVGMVRGLVYVVTGGRYGGGRHGLEEVPEQRPAARPRLTAAQRRELALRYRPCLVLFPEDADLGPPYRTGDLASIIGADYHPRPVEILLDHARLRHGKTQWLPDLPDPSGPDVIRASLGEPGESRGSLEIP